VATLAGLPPDRRTGQIDLATLRAGSEAVEAALGRLADAGTRVVVADADTPGHLTTLVEAATRLPQPVLLAGAGGLAAALAAWMLRSREAGGPAAGSASVRGARDHGAGAGRPGATAAAAPASASLAMPGEEGRPWLVVAGSQTEVTQHQVVELARAGAEVIALDVDELLARHSVAENEGWHATYLLMQGTTTVLRLVVPPLAAGAPSRGANLDERAARALGRACLTAALEAEPAGLFLTGGSTARACLLALGVSGLRLESEPLPGIAAGVAIGGRWDGRPVITKAGGFGAPDAIRRLVWPRSPGRVSLPTAQPSPPVA
jgi:uncharacterized protein YgbK (DUF1537 family)